MNFSEFRASKAFKGTFDEVIEVGRDLQRSMGANFTPEAFGQLIKKDTTMSTRLRSALATFTEQAAKEGMPTSMAKTKFINDFASELPGAGRDIKAMEGYTSQLKAIVTDNAGSTPLPAARRAERVAQPTGVIDSLIRNPEKLAKVGGPSVTQALRDYEAVLEGALKRINRDGVKELSDAEKVAFRAVGSAFKKDSTEAGRGITAAQAHDNFLDALGLEKGSKARQGMSDLLGKPEGGGGRKPPTVRQEPTLDGAPASRRPEPAPVAKAAEAIGDIRSDIADSMNRLIINVGNTNRLPAQDFFAALATKMRDPSQLQLVKALEETGRARPQSFKDIANAIKDGHKVSEDDFWALAKFFDKNLDVAAAKASAAQQQMVPGMVNAGRMGAFIQGGEKLFNKLSEILPQSAKAPSRNIISEWESTLRQPPSAPKRVLNGVLDSPIKFGVPAVATLAFAGNAYFTNFHSDLSYTGDWAKFRTGIAEWGIFGDEDSIKDHKDYNQVVGLIYRRLTTAGEIQQGSRFDTLSQKITGINVFTNDQRTEGNKVFGTKVPSKLDFSSAENIETLRHIVEKAQGVNGGVSGQFSTDELTAYKLYLSKLVHTTESDSTAWKPTTDGKALVTGWAQKTAMQMFQDPKLRDAMIQDYYGATLGSNDPALLKELHEKRGGPRAEAYFNVMSRYLVLTGKVDKLETTSDPKLINDFIGSVEKAAREKKLLELNKTGTDLYTEIGAANAGVAPSPPPTSAPQHNTDSICKIPSAKKLEEILDNASTLTDVPLKALQAAFRASVRDNCVSKDVVENELSKMIPEQAQARKAAAWVMKGLSEGP